jgi:hypothetical protein
MRAKCKGSKEKIPRESPYGRELKVEITVRWTPLNKTLVCPFCIRLHENEDQNSGQDSEVLLHGIGLLCDAKT